MHEQNTTSQLFWEDIDVGGELPTLVKKPTTKQVVMWAGAVDQYEPIHYDKDFALRVGFPGVILHGSMKGAFLLQLFTNHIGAKGFIRRIHWCHKQSDFPDKTIACRALVTRKYVEEGIAYVDFEIWIENEAGERTTEGAATVSLPRK